MNATSRIVEENEELASRDGDGGDTDGSDDWDGGGDGDDGDDGDGDGDDDDDDGDDEGENGDGGDDKGEAPPGLRTSRRTAQKVSQMIGEELFWPGLASPAMDVHTRNESRSAEGKTRRGRTQG